MSHTCMKTQPWQALICATPAFILPSIQFPQKPSHSAGCHKQDLLQAQATQHGAKVQQPEHTSSGSLCSHNGTANASAWM